MLEINVSCWQWHVRYFVIEMFVLLIYIVKFKIMDNLFSIKSFLFIIEYLLRKIISYHLHNEVGISIIKPTKTYIPLYNSRICIHDDNYGLFSGWLTFSLAYNTTNAMITEVTWSTFVSMRGKGANKIQLLIGSRSHSISSVFSWVCFALYSLV